MSESRVNGISGGGSQCGECKRQHNRQWRMDNAEKIAKQHSAQKRRMRYGMTQDQYDELLAAQNNRCAICRNKFVPGSNLTKACVDHDHAGGNVRAILCGSCNLGLGHFKDDKRLLVEAIRFLEQHSFARWHNL